MEKYPCGAAWTAPIAPKQIATSSNRLMEQRKELLFVIFISPGHHLMETDQSVVMVSIKN